jgi:vacuolar protein sorting-associated protein 16
VILGTPDHSIIVVDENDTEDQLLQDRIGAPITKIAVAPNGKFLACFRRDGVLTVLSVTFTTKVTFSLTCLTSCDLLC